MGAAFANQKMSYTLQFLDYHWKSNCNWGHSPSFSQTMRSGGPTSQNGPDVLIRGQLPPISLIAIECSVMRWLIGSIIALGRAINAVIRNESHSYAVSSMWDLFQSWTVLCLLGWQLFGPLLCMSPIMVMVDWWAVPRQKDKVWSDHLKNFFFGPKPVS